MSDTQFPQRVRADFGRLHDAEQHVCSHHLLNPANNRWSNLRLASRSQNNGNLPLRQDGSSGLKGAHWDRRSKRG